jgi:hypothetical protein
MRKVILIGTNDIAIELAIAMKEMALQHKVEIVVANTNDSFIDKEIKEPFVFGIKNTEDFKLINLTENYYEHEQSKFFGKPKRNFRKK